VSVVFEYHGPDWISFLPVISIITSRGRLYPPIEGEAGGVLVVIPHAVAVCTPDLSSGALRWHVKMTEDSGITRFSFLAKDVDMMHTGA